VTSESAAALHFSPLESARFGLRVYRASVAAIDAESIAAEIERERVDVAILRLPAQAIGSAGGLERFGFAPILADTQVVYETALHLRPAEPADASIALRPATREDRTLLQRTARAIFGDYTSHYHANPLFARERILDGYAEWAARHVGADDGSAAWLVEHAGTLAGFSCYRVEGNERTAIGVLNGVLPAARGRGVYRGMLRRMLACFAEAGLSRFEIATQTHNVVVQRVWAENGLSLRATYNTVHINALRGQAAGIDAGLARTIRGQ
jgi:GNAT superfamily N-acetyltransferase